MLYCLLKVSTFRACNIVQQVILDRVNTYPLLAGEQVGSLVTPKMFMQWLRGRPNLLSCNHLRKGFTLAQFYVGQAKVC